MRLAHQFSMENPKIKSALVEATEFPDLAAQYEVHAVPKTVIEGKRTVSFEGAYPEQMFLEKLQEALA